MKEQIKNASQGVLGCVVIVGTLLLAVFLIRGVVWVSNKALPWLTLASEILLAICILVLLPMCIFRKTRPWAGMGFYFGSYLLGLTLWVFSCLVCYEIWGHWALIVGLVLAGVGVFPVALIASVFTGHWSLLRDLLIQFVIVFGVRYLGTRLMFKRADTSEQTDEPLIAGEEL